MYIILNYSKYIINIQIAQNIIKLLIMCLQISKSFKNYKNYSKYTPNYKVYECFKPLKSVLLFLTFNVFIKLFKSIAKQLKGFLQKYSIHC